MRIIELQKLLDDTHAQLSKIERQIAKQPHLDSLRFMAASLEKRKTGLEAEFFEVASANGIEVCNYRIFEAGDHPKLTALAATLLTFQHAFTVIYDSLDHGPKKRARISANAEKATSFDYGFSYAGSTGIVLTLPTQEDLFNDKLLEAFLLFKSLCLVDSYEMISMHSKRIGSGSLKSFYKWAKHNSDSKYGIDVEFFWKNESERIVISNDSLRKIVGLLSSASEEEREVISISGQIVGYDSTKRSFHIVTDEAEYSGKLSSNFPEDYKLTVPNACSAAIIESRITKYSLDEELVYYYLDNITIQ